MSWGGDSLAPVRARQPSWPSHSCSQALDCAGWPSLAPFMLTSPPGPCVHAHQPSWPSRSCALTLLALIRAGWPLSLY
jgi:hypothetical protein